MHLYRLGELNFVFLINISPYPCINESCCMLHYIMRHNSLGDSYGGEIRMRERMRERWLISKVGHIE